MADPFRRVQVGDPIPRSAILHNATVDAARAEAARRGDRRAEPFGLPRQSGVVPVLNASGQDLAGRFAVLGLDAPIFSPGQSADAFAREVAWRGVVPTADHRGRFAVLLEPALDGVVARAVVSGVVPAWVSVDGPGQEYADCVPDDAGALHSADAGSAQILWADGDDPYYGHGYGYDGGLHLAYVRLGPPCGGWLGITTSVVSAAGTLDLTWGTGTARVYDDSGATPRLVGDRTIYNWFHKTIPSGTHVTLDPKRGGKLFVGGADC